MARPATSRGGPLKTGRKPAPAVPPPAALPATETPETPEPTPGPVGRALTAKQFWGLMERWGVADGVALDLIGFAGKSGKSGKRPRFRFLPHHQRVTTYLAEIDAALKTIGEDGTWLVRKHRSSPFGGQTPLAFMLARGLDGMDETLRFLHRSVWQLALKG